MTQTIFNSFTITFWFNTTAQGAFGGLIDASNPKGNDFGVYINNGVVTFRVGSVNVSTNATGANHAGT
jgi:hypothetical protein